MTSAQPAGAAGSGRDLRLDFFRGLALVFIFVDHIHRNFLADYTLQRFSFLDAAEVFVFISGYVSGIVYLKILLRKGFGAAIEKALRRCVRIYLAQAGVFFGSCLVLYYFARKGTLLEDFGPDLYAFLDHPLAASAGALTLLHAPGLAGLLPLYLILIAAVPAMLWALEKRPALTIGISVALYVVAQLAPGMTLYYLYPGRTAWFFHPLAWQLVFMSGVAMGWRRVHGLRAPAFLHGRAIVTLCAVLLAGIAVIECRASTWLEPFGVMRWLSAHYPDHTPLAGKTTAELLRLVNLALLVVVAGALAEAHRFWRSRAVRPVLWMGQQSLAVYSVSVVLSYFASAFAIHTSAGKGEMAALNLSGIAVLVGVAWVARWKDNWKSAARQAERVLWQKTASSEG